MDLELVDLPFLSVPFQEPPVVGQQSRGFAEEPVKTITTSQEQWT